MAENIVKQIKLPGSTTAYDVHDARVSESIATADSGKLLQVNSSGNIVTSTVTTTTISNKADKSEIPTKVSDLTNDAGYTTNTGTVTSVAVKMNNTTKGTVTSSGAIDLGTVITAHQSASAVNGASIGSATKGVYINSSGKPTAMTYSLNKDVPSDAKFTDTTYSSKSAASGGTDVSLVTTGEKYTWNNKSNTDEKVKSAASTANVDEPILLNNGTSATTNTVLYKSGATINPSTGNLKITKINGVTVGSSPKFTDTTPGTLNTNNTTAQSASSSEALSGTIKLHKVSKTGSYNDLNDKPSMPSKPHIETFEWPTSFSGSGPYTAPITVSGTTGNSKVDIQPSPAQIQKLMDDGATSCLIVNNGSGDTPSLTLTVLGAGVTGLGPVQVCVTEVTQ